MRVRRPRLVARGRPRALQQRDRGHVLQIPEDVCRQTAVLHPDDQSGGSTDMGDLSQILPIIHPRSGGAEGTGHGNNYFIKDYEKSVINPAKAMATTIIDLLWPDDMQINEVINNYKPNYSISEYITFQNKRMGNDFNDYTS